MTEFTIRITIGATVSAVVCAVLWALFFTFALPWPGHDAFTPWVFTLGAFVGIVLGQKGLTW